MYDNFSIQASYDLTWLECDLCGWTDNCHGCLWDVMKRAAAHTRDCPGV